MLQFISWSLVWRHQGPSVARAARLSATAKPTRTPRQTRSSFLKFESYSSCVVDLIGPRVNDGVLVEVIHGGHEPILEFLLGGNANVAQHRARKFGKEALDEVEPGAVLRREDKFKAVFAPTGKPSSGLFGDVRGMIVEDQLDRGSGRIGGVEQLEEFDEFAAAVAILDQSVDLAGDEINPSQQTDRAVPLVFMPGGKGRMPPGPRGRMGGGRSARLKAWLLVVRADRHSIARVALREGRRLF